jgi:hypothetical protein
MQTTQCVLFLGIIIFSAGFYLAFYVLTPTVEFHSTASWETAKDQMIFSPDIW